MPKKLNTNPKAQEARERKENQKQEKKIKELKAKEDAYWGDEGTTKTEQRKREAEAKKLEEMRKRQAKKDLEKKDQERTLKEISKITKPARQTQAELQAQLEAERAAEARQREIDRLRREENIISQDDILEHTNFNRLRTEQKQADMERYQGGVVDATSVDEALEQLTIEQQADFDRHPEKRMKAAFLKYQEEQLPILKEEYKNLKLSQYKEMMWKSWQKAPENPLNIAAAAAARET